MNDKGNIMVMIETRQQRKIMRSLEQLADLREKLEQLTEQKHKEIPKEVQAILRRLDRKYQPLMKEVNDQIQMVEKDVRSETLEYGESVKHAGLHAVYAKSHVTWDTGKLDGYALANPEILVCRKDSGPYVSIRKAQ